MSKSETVPGGTGKGALEGPDEIIYLDRSDDIGTLLQRLERVEGRHALIIVPGSEPLLASEVDLRLLKRRANALQLDVIVVAKDGLTRRLGREVGLRIYGSPRAGMAALRRLQRRHGTPRRAVVRDALKPQVVETVETARGRRKKSPAEQYRVYSARPKRSLPTQIAAALFLIALAAGLVYMLLLLVPEATVTVVPATQRVETSVTITADLNAYEVDFTRRIIPARVVEVRVEGTATIPTTEKRDAPHNRATGRVVFVNKTDEEVKIPAGTVVRTSTGTNVRFTTVNDVTVPAGRGSRMEADIIAELPGPSGNVAPYLITTVEGALALRVAVVNERATSGGDVKQVGVVTQADKQRLKDLLLQRLRQEALARMQEQLDAQEFVPPETVQVFVISEVYDKFVDEPADALTLELKAAANGVVIAGQDANAVALDALQRMVPSRYYLAAQGLSFERGPVVQIDEERRVSFIMTASGTAVARVETRGLRELVQGMPVAEAQALVADRLLLRRPPEIEVRPAWFGHMPYLPFRIAFVVVTELE
jgi:hypothetical protein